MPPRSRERHGDRRRRAICGILHMTDVCVGKLHTRPAQIAAFDMLAQKRVFTYQRGGKNDPEHTERYDGKGLRKLLRIVIFETNKHLPDDRQILRTASGDIVDSHLQQDQGSDWLATERLASYGYERKSYANKDIADDASEAGSAGSGPPFFQLHEDRQRYFLTQFNHVGTEAKRVACTLGVVLRWSFATLIRTWIFSKGRIGNIGIRQRKFNLWMRWRRPKV